MYLLRARSPAIRSCGHRFASSCLKWPQENPNITSSMTEIEAYWKKLLAERARPSGGGQHKYVLSMFPYPSGNLHMGHMRVYTISDVLARYYRLNGFDVVHPIGWDAFGLPAENAARDRGVDPREWTYANIETMKMQLKRTGVEFDWDREIFTCDPSYYRWTQWIFCKMHEKGLLRRSLSEVHWDPVDETVLAAEQIDANGRSWRSGALAEKRKLRQWAVETPKYAKRLLEGLKMLPDWKEVADIQANWIGKCDVFRFHLPLRNLEDDSLLEESFDLRIRNVTDLSRANFLVITAEHPLARKDRMQEEYLLENVSAMNVVTGIQMPIVVSAAINANEKESFLNARLGCSEDLEDFNLLNRLNVTTTKRSLNLTNNDVIEIAEFGAYGGYETSRTLVDWVVSRQRRWGTPIPMIISDDGTKAVSVPLDQLPLLAEQQGQRYNAPGLEGGSGLVERDTLDTFFDSSWYYLRYLDVHNKKALADFNITKPVDIYVGGIEHAAVHMFFARFVSYFLNDIGASAVHEPFSRLVPQGIVRGRTFMNPVTGEYVKPDQVKSSESDFVGTNGEKLDVVYEKMSKSKHNGVDPLVVIERDGIDLARLQLLEAAAPRSPINWGESDLKGLYKWLDRVAWIVNAYVEQRQAVDTGAKSKDVSRETEDKYKENYNYFVRNTSMLLEVLHLHNTAIMRLQGLTNALRKMDLQDAQSSVQFERCIHALIVMMQVFAPHTAAEFWAAVSSVPAIKSDEYNREADVWEQKWPQVDPDADIDFIMTVGDLNCGRISGPREKLEKLSDDEICRIAETQYHKSFFDHLKLKGYNVMEHSVEKRDGFYVTLCLKMDENVGVADIRGILDLIAKEKFKAKKASKSKKDEKKAKIAAI